MLKFYYSGAPNPTKVALFLEEAGLPYEAIPIDTRKGDQHKSEYLAVNPNAKVPAIVDGDVTVFDSNAILLYLAEKTGKFLPAKGDKAKSDKAKPDTADQAGAPNKGPSEASVQSADPDLDKDENPYGVKHVELVPRCPNCTEEMVNEHATICLNCGYNTMTRQWGRTEKTLGVTFERQLTYMLPALGSAALGEVVVDKRDLHRADIMAVDGRP